MSSDSRGTLTRSVCFLSTLMVLGVLAAGQALAAPPTSLDLSREPSIRAFFESHGFEPVPTDLVPDFKWDEEARTCHRANSLIGGARDTGGLVGLFVRRSDVSLHALCYFSPSVRLLPKHAAHACHLVGLAMAHFEGTRVWCEIPDRV